MGTTKDWSQLVFGALKLQRSNRPGASVGLTLRFGLEKIRIRRWGFWRRSIRIGIREADLKFILTDALMPDDDWAYDRSMSPFQEVMRTESVTLTALQESELGKDLKATLAGALKAGSGASPAEASVGLAATLEKKQKQSGERKDEIKDEYQFKRQLVTPSGGPANPLWNVKSVAATEALRGLAIKTDYFARIVENGAAPSVSLVAEIPRTGILVEDDSGSFTNLNRQRVALRRIQKALCDQPIVLQTVDRLTEPEGTST